VFSEHCTLTDAFPTDRTSVRLLPSVDALVLKEVGRLFEALAAVFTSAGLLPYMQSLMSVQAGNMAGLPTFLTLAVLLPGMCVFSSVGSDVGSGRSNPRIVGTHKASRLCVSSSV
jgi:hypothetical protein